MNDGKNDKKGDPVDAVKIFNIGVMKNLVDAKRLTNDIRGFDGASYEKIDNTVHRNGYMTMRFSADSFDFDEDDCKLLSNMMSKVDFFSASLLVATDMVALDFGVMNATEEVKND